MLYLCRKVGRFNTIFSNYGAFLHSFRSGKEGRKEVLEYTVFIQFKCVCAEEEPKSTILELDINHNEETQHRNKIFLLNM